MSLCFNNTGRRETTCYDEHCRNHGDTDYTHQILLLLHTLVTSFPTYLLFQGLMITAVKWQAMAATGAKKLDASNNTSPTLLRQSSWSTRPTGA
jgi:hypothetical protein